MEIVEVFLTDTTDAMSDENSTAVNVHVFNIIDYRQTDFLGE